MNNLPICMLRLLSTGSLPPAAIRITLKTSPARMRFISCPGLILSCKIYSSILPGPSWMTRIAWSVDELVQVLAQADMAEVLKDFGKQMGKEDPVVHFYETFLKAYDPAVREMRGVYYTPEPVVSYIVRSIDYLLKTRFNKPQGLADPDTLILDPAVGTATFLYKVIDEIHHSFVKQGQQGVWNNYVAEKLLPRLFGFELLMAPYAIAHFKLGLQLKDIRL